MMKTWTAPPAAVSLASFDEAASVERKTSLRGPEMVDRKANTFLLSPWRRAAARRAGDPGSRTSRRRPETRVPSASRSSTTRPAAVCRSVELRTVNQIRYVTDSNGIAAFDEPGLLGLKVFFHIKSHGYEFPKDGFGNRGLALETSPGGSARIKIERLNIARRLYRVTGRGSIATAF